MVTKATLTPLITGGWGRRVTPYLSEVKVSTTWVISVSVWLLSNSPAQLAGEDIAGCFVILAGDADVVNALHHRRVGPGHIQRLRQVDDHAACGLGLQQNTLGAAQAPL